MSGIRDDVSALFKLFSQVAFLLFYPLALFSALIYFRFGIYDWLIVGAFVVPPTLCWYVIVKRRLENYIRSITSRHEWNIDKAFAEYMNLLRAQEKGD